MYSEKTIKKYIGIMHRFILKLYKVKSPPRHKKEAPHMYADDLFDWKTRFFIRPWFDKYNVCHTDTNGKTWYLAKIHRDRTTAWTCDSLYARHFTGRTATKFCAELNACTEVTT